MKSGLISLIGKPNVGKSTLLNTLVGQKVSIVSNKPQTTRRRVLGIASEPEYQVAFVDTPGIHEPHTRLGRAMVEQARASLADVDAILYVADVSKKPEELDIQIAKLLQDVKVPVLLCLNKMDLLKPEFVVPYIEAYTHLFGTENYMLTTATRAENTAKLMQMVVDVLPEGDSMYPDDEFTNQSMRFMAAELIREKVLQNTRQEVPHATAVQIEEWSHDDATDTTHILAEIVVEKAGQRAIILGKGGQFIKEIGAKARLEIEAAIGNHVYLELHVKVREDWRMNPRMLQEMEYVE